MKLSALVFSALAALGLAGTAAANPVLSDLTPADYVTVGGLDWAWASPVTSQSWYGSNTLYAADLHAGWREATNAEWATRPLPDVFGTSNSFKCAAKYWNSSFTHCDYGNGYTAASQHLTYGSANYLDLFYVRDAGGGQVPEPATLALVGLALAGIAAARKKKVD